MKFKGLTKLAMSGVALAAVAATLGTSTYAWYVTNSTATATNIEARTKTSDGSNLLVSKDGSDFSSKVVFNTTDPVGYDNLGVKTTGSDLGVLDPVTVDGTAFTGQFVTYDETGALATQGSGTDVTTLHPDTYLHFHLWIKSSKDTNVQPTLSAVNNTAASLPAQKAYYSTGADGVIAGSTFTVDAMRALRTSITTTVESGTTVTSTANVTYSSSNTTVYETEKIAKQANFTSNYTINDTVGSLKTSSVAYVTEAGSASTVTATGAHAYYTAVMAHEPGKVEETLVPSSAESISTIALTADTAVRLDFFVWLEGSDTYCFDACGGQYFTFGLEFSKVANNG